MAIITSSYFTYMTVIAVAIIILWLLNMLWILLHLAIIHMAVITVAIIALWLVCCGPC